MINRRLPKGAYERALALGKGERIFYHTAGRIEFIHVKRANKENNLTLK